MLAFIGSTTNPPNSFLYAFIANQLRYGWVWRRRCSIPPWSGFMRLLIAGSIVFLAASAVSSQMRIPNRSQPLFKGAQGAQKTEIHYDPATGTVTLKLLVQDPNGYFIPDIRRENFVVYE